MPTEQGNRGTKIEIDISFSDKWESILIYF